uniref:Uncharacterized protein n=1 Tax=Salix viminalis TaxID=40686 RepID=A0A6N2LGP3_SALVM
MSTSFSNNLLPFLMNAVSLFTFVSFLVAQQVLVVIYNAKTAICRQILPSEPHRPGNQ